MSEPRATDHVLWTAGVAVLFGILGIVGALWNSTRPASPCRDEVRVVPLNAPSFCGQNQHRVVVVPYCHGETHPSMIVHCTCAQEREVVRVLP